MAVYLNNSVEAVVGIFATLKAGGVFAVINVLPFSFDYGLCQLLMVFKVGGRPVLERSFAYPAAILKGWLKEHKRSDNEHNETRLQAGHHCQGYWR